MVQGRKEFKNRKSMLTILEKEELDLLDEIRWREHISLSEIGRKAVQEYIKNHSSGNDTFKITDFEDPEFKAMPATMSSKEKWSKFIRGEMNKEERMELDNIAKHIRDEIDAKNWLDSRK